MMYASKRLIGGNLPFTPSKISRSARLAVTCALSDAIAVLGRPPWRSTMATEDMLHPVARRGTVCGRVVAVFFSKDE